MSAPGPTSVPGAARPAPAGAPAAPLIAIEHVSRRFDPQGQDAGLLALDDVSLNVAAGEFIALIGPSGCGKSTLMRIIGDLIEPTSGSVRVKGKTPRQARLDRDYGIVFQAPVLYDWRTVEKNVQLPLEVMHYPAAERQARARAMLDLVGLAEFARRYPWQLSGGMQQRVAIARALAFNPSILLMDEPFGALDELTRERMNDELLRIWTQTQTTVIFVTHSLQEAVFLSTRVVVMTPRPGRLEKIVPVDLPYPRTAQTREDPHFFELVTAVRAGLREH